MILCTWDNSLAGKRTCTACGGSILAPHAGMIERGCKPRVVASRCTDEQRAEAIEKLTEFMIAEGYATPTTTCLQPLLDICRGCDSLGQNGCIAVAANCTGRLRAWAKVVYSGCCVRFKKEAPSC